MAHDCNVSKNAALQLSNGRSVNRGAFDPPCGRMPSWLELALMLVLSQNRAHDMRVVLKFLNRKETNYSFSCTKLASRRVHDICSNYEV